MEEEEPNIIEEEPYSLQCLKEDYQNMLDSPSDEFIACPFRDDYYNWHFIIRGPRDCEADNLLFHGSIQFTEDYPDEMPRVYLDLNHSPDYTIIDSLDPQSFRVTDVLIDLQKRIGEAYREDTYGSYRPAIFLHSLSVRQGKACDCGLCLNHERKEKPIKVDSESQTEAISIDCSKIPIETDNRQKSFKIIDLFLVIQLIILLQFCLRLAKSGIASTFKDIPFL